MNNLTSDGIETLNGCDLPITSFSLVGFLGAPGCGKSTNMQKLAEAVIKYSNQTTYDLDKPEINNGKITHHILISPSINTDNSLANKDKKILIQGTDQNILNLVDSIKEMNEAFYQTLHIQKFLRTIAIDIYNQKYNKIQLIHLQQQLKQHPQYDLIIKSLEALNKFKDNYPELLFKENNQNIVQVLSDISGGKFDGYMTRRPKIILLLDDLAGSRLYSSTLNNAFYNLLCIRRHQGLFLSCISLHSPGNLQYSFKMQFNSFLVFKGVPIDKLKLLYDCITSLDSVNFNVNDFIKMYQNITGYNETDMSKKDDFRYNFLYIQSQPITAIYLNFDQKLK
ncbi:Conserved_hypothetical protein [Hexamita inflata]|uniref:Uncharacterized protein n=1 Tax=Hexamita inflata TaxID=28002 RepID=A0AA86PBY7_9EUKA|nr:Conserved hypothetical protein [Hexamita inflata]